MPADFLLHLNMVLKERIIRFATKFQDADLEQSFPLDYCIPVYHAVSDVEVAHLKHVIHYKKAKDFESDLDELSRLFQFVTWDEFKDFHSGAFQPKKKIALLTFDDGLSEFYFNAVPVLLRKGIYAVNFINPKFVENNELMFRGKASVILEKIISANSINPEILKLLGISNSEEKTLKKQILKIPFERQELLDQIADLAEVDLEEYVKTQKPYMNLEQLKALNLQGFGISNHGWDHPLYKDLPLSEQIENTQKGAEFLGENQFLTDGFAFPFTDFGVGNSFFDQIFQHEYYCTFGSAGIKRDSVTKNFQRIPMENGKSASQTLKEEVAYFNLKKMINRNQIVRR
ncbi:polysaccharide deacetylase family protein [Chryseobacterium koreense]|uniref:polysaccharide deacetylase family protein n=1 Tax=Chryseobacterium koreense TaxID=232216 RepID=UPI0026EA2E9A|nr:polysaccharide deacetylase family protein [Chryseobacterium koreense]